MQTETSTPHLERCACTDKVLVDARYLRTLEELAALIAKEHKMPCPVNADPSMQGGPWGTLTAEIKDRILRLYSLAP